MASNTLSGAGVSPANTKAQLLHIGTGTAAAGAIRTGDGTATVLELVAGGFKVAGTLEATGTFKSGGLTLTPALGATTEDGIIEPVRVAKVAADVSNATVTLAAVTGLSLPVVANGLYQIDAIIPTQSAATTTGARFQIDGPTGITWLAAKWSQQLVAGLSTGANGQEQNVRAWATPFSPASAPEANQPFLTLLTGMVKISGTAPSAEISISFASEVAASAVMVLAGAILRLTRIS